MQIWKEKIGLHLTFPFQFDKIVILLPHGYFGASFTQFSLPRFFPLPFFLLLGVETYNQCWQNYPRMWQMCTINNLNGLPQPGLHVQYQILCSNGLCTQHCNLHQRFLSKDKICITTSSLYGSSMACTGPSKFCHSTFAPGALHDKVPSVLKTNYINVFEMLFSYKCFIFFFCSTW